ncbi:MAG: ArsR family transcriptional regulator [Candidatus Nomurabacteria bacterium]|nr:ArsR family transcriptional regulator [Candidatus Nomurabacteria bacterium]
MIDKTLEKLSLKSEEIKAFIYMLENGEQTVGMLAKKIGISRPSLYGFLTNLQKQGLVIESQKNGIKTFSVVSKERIDSFLNQKIEDLTRTKTDIQNLFVNIQTGKIVTSPKFQFFDGKDGVQHVLKDLLLYHNIETQAYWPIKAMIEILSEDFFIYLNKERIKRNIYTEAIWPENQKIDIAKHPYMGAGEDFLREIRIAPEEIDFSMGYWIYENKVAFISSKKECFGFIIESKEFAKMLLSQHQLIWKVSKPISISTNETKKFIENLDK